MTFEPVLGLDGNGSGDCGTAPKFGLMSYVIPFHGQTLAVAVTVAVDCAHIQASIGSVRDAAPIAPLFENSLLVPAEFG
jgi:hypothetical protein